MDCIIETNFSFPRQKNFYKGKVRDVYTIGDELLVMIASDRISAFDVVLPKGIPHKGRILNGIAKVFLEKAKEILPVWLNASPDPNVSIGFACEPFKVEMVIRGYLCGHAWREYKLGKRMLCGVAMPDGMKENDRFPIPIITPSTKASVGHDEDISRDEIIKKGLVRAEHYDLLENYTRALFEMGTKHAASQGLILCDTKYEFGLRKGVVTLMDEIHTPDSSRYFYAAGYEDRQAQNKAQKQLSKEFVREWLMENGFQGKEGQVIPEMTEEVVNMISNRYIELYENITGLKFVKPESGEDVLKRMEENILKWISVQS